jgi:hypothetical protein
MRYPGEVWYLPPEERVEGDFKWRRHVLLTPCEEQGDLGIFAYATTAAIEAKFGGAGFLIDPYANTYRHTGFSVPTYVMPCRLIPVISEDMQRMVGRIIDEMPAIKNELRRALGLGTGTRSTGAASGSLRGCVVELGDALAVESGVRFGVIVTEAGYSFARRYQLIVPILDATEYDAQPTDVVVTGTPWTAELRPRMGEVILAAGLIQTAFHPLDIARVSPVVVDEATIAQIDRTLVQVFRL